MSLAELLSTSVTLLVAGHETTTHLIGNGLFAPASAPRPVPEAEGHPTLMTSAIEEFLRYNSPLQRQLRKAAGKIEIGGKQIEKAI